MIEKLDTWVVVNEIGSPSSLSPHVRGIISRLAPYLRYYQDPEISKNVGTLSRIQEGDLVHKDRETRKITYFRCLARYFKV